MDEVYITGLLVAKVELFSRIQILDTSSEISKLDM